MTFDLLKQSISKIQNIELPGVASHKLMVPEGRNLSIENVKEKARNAGVMVMFYPNSFGEAYLVLTLRKTYKGVHSNQISLPGGKAENTDVDIKATAVRETHEEVGVVPSSLHVVKQLSQVYIPPSNFLVNPFLGYVDEQPVFIKQETEVARIIEVPVSDLLDESLVFETPMKTSYAERILVPAFKLRGYTVWGATAMVLSEAKTILKQSI